MKAINIFSLAQAHTNLSPDAFKNYLKFFGIELYEPGKKGKSIKTDEIEDISKLIKLLYEIGASPLNIFENYYLGYTIPQISKEFDLLRFGENYIVNIEIKKESSSEKIIKQLELNSHYLSHINKPVRHFTFISDENKIYEAIDASEIQEVTPIELFNTLRDQEIIVYDNIDTLFDPSLFLVSPFNLTDKFMNNNYFLTSQQEEFERNINSIITNRSSQFIGLSGGAGTGKTLLTYHIAKQLMQQDKRVLILHCAQLNNGQDMLNNTYGWTINSAKYIDSYDFNSYDIVIIDEAQRLYLTQYQKLMDKSSNQAAQYLFSYDKRQCLSKSEHENNIVSKIESLNEIQKFGLSDKIRTNPEAASFIRKLFDKTNNMPYKSMYSNIGITYVKDFNEAKHILDNLANNNWKVPNYTPGTRSKFHYEKYKNNDPDCAHSIIGQEYDNIAAVIDPQFHYDEHGKLNTYRGYYSQKDMLYQILTRVRKKIHLIIIDNEEILNRCLEVLNT